MLEVSLLALEVKVGFDNPVYSPHVRIAIDVKSPHKLSNILGILPLFNTLIKAEVYQGNGWRSAYARCAVEVDLKLLLVDHVVEMLGGDEERCTE